MSGEAARPLLSRVANSVYWVARYIERAENVARIVGVNFHLQLGLSADPAGQWQPLVDTTGDARIFKARYGLATEHSVIRFLIFDWENPNSILSCVAAARENARSIRETISSSMWEQINALYLLVRSREHDTGGLDVQEFVREIRMGCALCHGVTQASMTRDEAYHFLRLGGLVERADKTTRLLDVKYFFLLPSVSDIGSPLDDVQWGALMKSAGGLEMYRKRHRVLGPSRIVEFLLMDGEFPRSVRFCLSAADRALHRITGSPPGSYSCPSERMLGRVRADLDYSSVDRVLNEGLHEFLDDMQAKLNEIDKAIFADFFAQELLGRHTAGG